MLLQELNSPLRHRSPDMYGRGHMLHDKRMHHERCASDTRTVGEDTNKIPLSSISFDLLNKNRQVHAIKLAQ